MHVLQYTQKRTSYKNECAFGLGWKKKIISLFNLFLLLFMGPTTLFNIIYEFYYIILTNFYFYLQYFQQ